LRYITLSAPAKINLSLDVTGKLENGYHTLETVMQAISLKDEIVIERAPEGIDIHCSHPLVPCDSRNICAKAAQAFFQETSLTGGAKIKILKNIPVGAGLGGGSSNAAAVLKGLNILYDARLTDAVLSELGLKCGADVPFFLKGGTCLATGIGEKLLRLPPFSGVHIVLIMPPFRVSTAMVYSNYRMDAPVSRPDTEQIVSAIYLRDIPKVAMEMKNVLESVTVSKHPELQDIKRELKANGALGALMSGSGPSVFGLFEDGNKAGKAYKVLKKHHKQIYHITTT
jgi:4-diphosphocytidyl-2-C-methyl-D-erythritol kinase